ncbi:hypothetical protein QJ850_gp682 [Acanthamoeba polyphaga mimivirus]|uniref:Uncharacterized protein n=1 Tax=Acanthamoeba polyphaga mimivirus Kroon TaxID=3069720 RepID=A0A0G2Y8A9_9VIRU|nr:hypothetical protein QJ850_gp682 [Acanthamoeba polyphaga mimivirus]AKI80017.1 hypothetical protein [Acanthamoeba polyphaga mimivirus Kroon]
MENLIVAISNFPALFPIGLSLLKKDFITFGIITFVSTASFISHLIENHKHGMSGIGFSQRTSYVWNRLDVLGCVLSIARFSYLYYNIHGLSVVSIVNNKWLFAMIIPAFILLRVSEYDKYNPNLKTRYIITHCMWHVCIFNLMYYFLKNIVY